MHKATHFRIKSFRIVFSDTGNSYTVELVCDGCTKKRVTATFMMPARDCTPESYLENNWSVNIDQCLLKYGVFSNHRWWKNSEYLNLCPSCQKKLGVKNDGSISSELSECLISKRAHSSVG